MYISNEKLRKISILHVIILLQEQISDFLSGSNIIMVLSFSQYYKPNLKREYGTDEREQGHGKQTVAEHWRGARERDRFVG